MAWSASIAISFWPFEIIKGFGFVLPKAISNNEEIEPSSDGYVADFQ
jgi:hypothetical protein